MMRYKLNEHALNAWAYVWETYDACKGTKDEAFIQFISDLMDAYPAEYYAIDSVIEAFHRSKEYR
jgi:hypothetical protein